MIHCHMMVYGEVQGVGYRYFTLQNAKRFDITGWVANNYDGTVEIDAQGTEFALEAFIQILEQGPSHACVERVLVTKIAELEDYRSFRIR